MRFLILENGKINRIIAEKKEDYPLKDGQKIYDNIELGCYETLTVENNEIVKIVDCRGVTFYDEEKQEKNSITEKGVDPESNWILWKESLDYLKEQKILSLDKLCNEEILSGFKSSALGTEHKYSSDEEAQRNLLGAARRADKSEDTPYVCTNSEETKDMLIHTPSQMLTVIDDGEHFKIECIAKFHGLRKQILDPECDSESKINLFAW